MSFRISFSGGHTQINQDGFLARELPVHQGGVRDEAPQDGRVDGEC